MFHVPFLINSEWFYKSLSKPLVYELDQVLFLLRKVNRLYSVSIRIFPCVVHVSGNLMRDVLDTSLETSDHNQNKYFPKKPTGLLRDNKSVGSGLLGVDTEFF